MEGFLYGGNSNIYANILKLQKRIEKQQLFLFSYIGACTCTWQLSEFPSVFRSCRPENRTEVFGEQ